MQSAYHARSLRVLPKLAFTITIGLITTVASYKAAAQDVFTDPVGFMQLPAQTNSDTYLSLPFSQIDQYRGVVGSVSGSKLTDANTPGWTAGQWMYGNGANSNPHNTYYALFITGNDAGAYFIVTNNDAGDLYVEASPTAALTSANPGDTYRIYPFWTLNSAFPGGAGVQASTGTTGGTRKTEVLFPDIGGSGINLAASAIYYFLQSATATNWAIAGGAASNVNDQIILPEQYVVIRQQNNSSTTTPIALGAVPEWPLQIPLYGQPAAQQDSFVGIVFPATQTLSSLGLTNNNNGNGFLISGGTTGGTRKDELLTFTSGAQGINPAANNIYYLVNPTAGNSGWRLAGGGTTDVGTNTIPAGTGIIIRKFQTNLTTVVWTQLQNY
jgi:uncharacterized protein (TIGR02597 family)